jgi:hypothetical protein
VVSRVRKLFLLKKSPKMQYLTVNTPMEIKIFLESPWLAFPTLAKFPQVCNKPCFPQPFGYSVFEPMLGMYLITNK